MKNRIPIALVLLAVTGGVAGQENPYILPTGSRTGPRPTEETVLNDYTVTFRNEYYMGRRTQQETMQVATGAIALLGDSLTERGPWGDHFPEQNILNFGIGGDTVDGMTDRLDFITATRPAVIFIMAGTNDILFYDPDPRVLIGKYSRMVSRIREECPHCPVYLQSVVPVNEEKGGHTDWITAKNPKIVRFNEMLRVLAAESGAGFIDVHSKLVREGVLGEEYTTDGVHLNDAGYNIWSSLLHPYIEQHPL